ncbi:DUF2339 domain-containing protein [Orbus mooreae]|uniref:DUF2339 domain-containing protein n=1 Tax=Orbus mooreae TaxID=3074107 RepID=UPI00370D26EB
MAGIILLIALVVFVIAWIAFANLQARVTGLQLQIQALKKRIDTLSPLQNSETVKNQSTQTAVESVAHVQHDIAKQQNAMAPSVIQPTLAPQTPISSAELVTQTTPKVIPNIISTKTQQYTEQKQIDKNSLSYRFTQWLIKGNPVAKVAIIILFFGLSYLLKYSIDHGLLSPEIRILGSLCLGLVLLTIGWRLRKKKELYALILQGGAIGVLYFTLFAAFKLYALVPMLLTFALLVIVCSTSVMFAVLQRAISLAIIACVGGYLAPILLSTGSGNHIALFSYYLLISCAILVISFWQSWRVLNLIGFIFTYVVALLWGMSNFKAEFYLECQIFIIANMLIYGVLAVLLSVRNTTKEPNQNAFDLFLLLSVPLLAFCLQYSITVQFDYAPAFSALGFGLFYLVGAFITLRRWKNQAKQLALYGLAIGLGFTTLAVPLALTAQSTALVWLLEGTAISYVTLSQKQYRFSWAGVIIVLLGTISSSVAANDSFSNSSFILLYGVTSAILLFNACLWHYYRALHSSSEPLKILFIILAALAWSVWIIGSIERLSTSSNYIVQPIIACYVAAVWLWFMIGRKIEWSVMRYAVIALWPVLFLSLANNMLFYIHDYYAGLWGLSWLFAFLSGYIYLYLDRDNLAKCNTMLVSTLHISLLWIVLAWLYYNISWLLSFLPWGFEVVKASILMIFTCIVILVCFVLKQYRRYPLQMYQKQYWLIGLLPVALYLLFSLITGLYSSGQIVYWTYIPFINPLEESAGFTLMMLAVWLHQVSKLLVVQNRVQTNIITPSLLISLFIISLIFLWGNSIILRTISQLLDLSWSFYVLWHNNIVQVVLSLVWTLSALILIVIAHRYVLRNLWFVGAILQVIVVLKLVFVDSVELDGLMRAFVFIGVALLMLVIGYLAPIPPRAKHETP